MNSVQVARIFKGLSEGLRLRLVRLLAREELNVNELRSILDVPQSTLSRHLAVLKEIGLIETRRQGTWSYYRLSRSSDELPDETTSGELVRLATTMLEGDESSADDLERLDAVREHRRRAVKDHFETAGREWDDLHREVADHSVKLRALLRLIPSDCVLLDVGCGSGYLLPDLAVTGARIIAVDNAPARLAAARDTTNDLGLTDIDFREGDLAALPVDDASVDAAFAHLVLHHAPTPDVAIAEIARTLRPGGSLVVTDFLSHEEAWLRDEHADIWLGFEPDDVERWMRRTGLTDIRTDRYPFARPGDDAATRTVAGLRLFVTGGCKPPTATEGTRP